MKNTVEICYKCLQPYPGPADKCPQCGHRQINSIAEAALVAGAVTVGVIACVAFIVANARGWV